jgi:diguanylate cyclase (GGDEF)-like protein
LVVNNVFSRLPIGKEDIENLDILANQAAVTLEKAKLYQEVKELSIRDSLTGLYSHNFFLGRFEEEAKRAGREKKVFSLIIIDIDGFKRYNDLYGHQSGDEIILALSRILKQNIRTFDVKGRPIDAIGRYGGDEFVVLLTNSDKDSALAVGNRLRDAVKAQQISAGGKTVTFSISIGIAIYPNDGGTPQQLFKKADDALYWAKQHGKDQLCLASDIGRNPAKEIF